MPWLGLSALVVVLDQLSKAWVLATLPEFQAGAGDRRLLELVPHLQHRRGIQLPQRRRRLAEVHLRGAGRRHQRGARADRLTRTPRGDWRTALPFALIIGGALGNVIDRLLHGHVVDFIQWYWHGHYWPAFNLADSAIVAGAVGIGLFGLIQGKPAADAG